jgi:GNAT superfamily N-acetyltransferase
MPTYTIVTAQESERYYELSNGMVRADGPAFLEHDSTVARYWPFLEEAFPDNQFCLVEQESGKVVGIANSIPIAFKDAWADLPAEGLDWVLQKGFRDRATSKTSTILSALYIEVADTHRGHHLSSQMLTTMCQIARSQGFSYLIAPVRPSLKSRYPLIEIEAYLNWQTPEGLPFDPWLRVHVRAGGKILHSCSQAMSVKGTRQQWVGWTGMDFPGDGNYVISHGLVPLTIRGTEGEYVEPGIWVLHELQQEQE